MSARAEDVVLVLNAGSSSLKFALFDVSSSPVRIVSGVVDPIGSDKASLDDDVALGKFVAHVSEIRTSASAVAIKEMAIETASVAKNFCTSENRTAGCANHFFR
jgi:acetate kinase